MRIIDIIQKYGLVAKAEPYHDLKQTEIHGVAAIDRAGPGTISFFTKLEYAPLLARSPATALLVREYIPAFPGIQLIHKDPQFIFAKIALEFYRVDHGPLGVHPQAQVHPTAKLGRELRIHAGAHVAANVEIGDRAVLYPGVYLGQGAKVGADTVLHAQVVVYHGCVVGDRCLLHAGTVIGADGFGFSVSDDEICKIPQLGIVRVGNDVEFGALCTVDRAAAGETVIGDSCKFDDRVHIGHNCRIGSHSMFSAQVGIAGSTEIGAWALIGGQSGVADHLKLGERVRIAAKTAVLTHLPEAGTYVGHPAIPMNEWKRQVVYLKRLKEYDLTIKSLVKRIDELEQRLQK